MLSSFKMNIYSIILITICSFIREFVKASKFFLDFISFL